MGRFGTAMNVVNTAAELGKNANNIKEFTEEFRGADKKEMGKEMGRKAGRAAFTEAAEAIKTTIKTFLKVHEVIPRTICRVTQFVLALIVCGFYGNRVSADREAGNGYSAEWLFAILIGGLSAVTAVLFGLAAPITTLPYIGSKMTWFKTYRAWSWDVFLSGMWTVMWIIFMVIFVKRDSDNKYKGSSTGLMKTAMWVDLVNAILWVISGFWGYIKTRSAAALERRQEDVRNGIFRKPTDDNA